MDGEALLCDAARDAAAFAKDDALLGIKRHPGFSAQFRTTVEQRWFMRQAVESTLATIAMAQGELHGYCLCCRSPARFSVPSSSAVDGAIVVDWSESLLCASCGLISRQRFCIAELLRHIDPHRSEVYITEQATPLFAWLQSRLARLTGSEFVEHPDERAAVQRYLDHIHGANNCLLRYEDVTRLSFADGSFDALMSLEVLEHVPDYRQALREYARVLRPQGVAILSAPFGELTEHTVVRATVAEDGTITHLLEPEYHGDPASGVRGCLCYYSFGWDLLDEIRAAGFASAEYLDAWEPAYGIIGAMAVFVARR